MNTKPDLPSPELAMRRVADAITELECVLVDAHMSVRRACSAMPTKHPRVASSFLAMVHAVHNARVSIFTSLETCVLAGVIDAAPAIVMSNESRAKADAASERMKPELEDMIASIETKVAPGSAMSKLIEIVRGVTEAGGTVEVVAAPTNEKGECMCSRCTARRAAGVEELVH